MSDMEKHTSAANAEIGSAADVDEVLKKYDRESNTRIWEGKPKLVIRWLMVFFSLYSIYVTLFSTAMRQIRLMNFLGMILVIGYLNFPAKKGTQKVNHMPWYDVLIMVVGAFGFFYASIHGAELANLRPKFIRGDMFLLVIACLSILAMMELCRRSVGVPILIVVGILLVYTFASVDPTKVIYDQFYATSGIMNTPIDVCAKYIVVFLIFGAFLERTGISTFFIDLANSIAGSTAGGPAKVAVISSGLCGMVSGSSVGNTRCV